MALETSSLNPAVLRSEAPSRPPHTDARPGGASLSEPWSPWLWALLRFCAEARRIRCRIPSQLFGGTRVSFSEIRLWCSSAARRCCCPWLGVGVRARVGVGVEVRLSLGLGLGLTLMISPSMTASDERKSIHIAR
eukprot:scaffold1297_cov41-Phaeocystis_antarctica.AAC.2